jgi:hypothetical protein
MALNIGTLVKPYEMVDVDESGAWHRFTCNQGVCVGIITEFHEPDGGAKTDAEIDVTVKWLDLCMLHAMRYNSTILDFIPTHTTTKIDNLYEIGQTR